jgi:hypothetical protein
MRLLLILIFTFFSANTFALSYEYQTTVCAEITVQDKSTKNCAGNAVFNQASAGKYNLVITFKVKDFEIEDSRTNKKFEKTIERNLQKNIIFQSPEFTAEEWTKRRFSLNKSRINCCGRQLDNYGCNAVEKKSERRNGLPD